MRYISGRTFFRQETFRKNHIRACRCTGVEIFAKHSLKTYNYSMKYPERKLAVIIPAAGSGKRMGQAVPKPLIRLDGMTILERTLRRFSELPLYEMIVVISEAIRKETERICSRLETPFPLRLAVGGKERQDSVWNALGALDRESDIVAVHDAARPFFDPGFFRRAFSLLETHDGVVAGCPAAYTMKKVSGMLIQETLPREALWQANTPQIFHRKILEDAYRDAMENGFYGTDDAMLVERRGGRVAVTPDTPQNIKITTVPDLFAAEQILKQEKEKEYVPYRTGI